MSAPKWSKPVLDAASDAALPDLQDSDLEALDEYSLDPWSDLFAATVTPSEQPGSRPPTRPPVRSSAHAAGSSPDRRRHLARPTLHSVVLDPVAQPPAVPAAPSKQSSARQAKAPTWGRRAGDRPPPPPALLPDDPRQPSSTQAEPAQAEPVPAEPRPPVPTLHMPRPEPLDPAPVATSEAQPAADRPALRKVLVMATAGLLTGTTAGLIAAAVAHMVS